jgi:hypothetical protein
MLAEQRTLACAALNGVIRRFFAQHSSSGVSPIPELRPNPWKIALFAVLN